ncbi:MAG: hypothetical protein ACYTFK_11935 [Planctomycetota bacterium]|jgi:hypothetical protein
MVKTVWLGVVMWIMLAGAIAVGTHREPPGGGGAPVKSRYTGPAEMSDYAVGEWYHADQMPCNGEVYKCGGAVYTHYITRIEDSVFEGGVHPVTGRYAWHCRG